jgi:hypothetical protein
MVSVSDTLSAISDDESLVLFNTIASASGDKRSRLSDLINAGLVRRINGKYFVTSFGKVVYKAQELIGMAVQYSLKLKAIDSVESSKFPAAELSKIINTLISNGEIKRYWLADSATTTFPLKMKLPATRSCSFQ